MKVGLSEVLWNVSIAWAKASVSLASATSRVAQP